MLNLTFYLGGLELYKYSSDSSLGHVEVTLPYLNEIEIHLLNSDSMAVVIKKISGGDGAERGCHYEADTTCVVY